MSEPLPENWAEASLSEVVSHVGDRADPQTEPNSRYLGLEHVEAHTTKILEGGSAAEMKSSSPRFRKGDVLYSRLRPYLNKVCTPDFDGLCSGEFLVLRPEAGIDPDFLKLRINSYDFVNFASHLDDGDRPRVKYDEISEFSFWLPPFAEQLRLLAALDAALAKIDEAEEALERVTRNLDRYRASVLKAACEGRLVPTEAETARREGRDYEPAPQLLQRLLATRRAAWEQAQLDAYARKGKTPPKDWKSRYQEPQPPDTSKLPELPEGWCWASNHQVGETQLGRQRAPQHQTGDHMRPYLRVANVFEDRIDTSNVLWMNFTPAEFERYELVPGDILLNEGQSPELVGRPAMYRGGIGQCCYQKTLLRFRAYRGVQPEFALATFRKNMRCGRFRKAAKITTSIAHLTQEIFIGIEFALPPESEQQRIVEEVKRRLSCIDSMAKEIELQIKRCHTLRQSFLKHAFSGKLVPQEPTDEPASVLLERIRAERAAMEAPAKVRKPAARKKAKSS